jgi:hypothetical protein
VSAAGLDVPLWGRWLSLSELAAGDASPSGLLGEEGRRLTYASEVSAGTAGGTRCRHNCSERAWTTHLYLLTDL